MLIAISGRKSSGKTTLAEILLQKGFQKASFATGLKEYVGELYNWTQADMNSQAGKEAILNQPVFWDDGKCKQLSELIGENLVFGENKSFIKRREALQYIGTEVLRRHNPDFHLNEFNKRYLNGNFVCDDIRFPNELKMLKNMGAICCYLIRPYFWEYINHESEVAVSYVDFENVIVNDGSLHKLIIKFNIFFNNLIVENDKVEKKRLFDKNELLNTLKENYYDTKICAKKLNCSRDNIVWWATSYMIDISRNSYKLNHNAFNVPNFENSYWAGLLSADGCIKKHLKYSYLLELSSLDYELVNGFKSFLKTDKPIYLNSQKSNNKIKYHMTVSSPYLVEDLKSWNVEPRKSKYNKIPDCIRSNEELLCYWLVGLIDGDGSIYKIKKANNIGISILASLEIVKFINNWLNIPCCFVQEKNIDNLFNLKFSGKNVVKLYNKIYRGMGLKRKWEKVAPFIDRKWHH